MWMQSVAINFEATLPICTEESEDGHERLQPEILVSRFFSKPQSFALTIQPTYKVVQI
jgi:hypothetical protein